MAKKQNGAVSEPAEPVATHKCPTCETELKIPEGAFSMSGVFCPVCRVHYPPDHFVSVVN